MLYYDFAEFIYFVRPIFYPFAENVERINSNNEHFVLFAHPYLDPDNQNGRRAMKNEKCASEKLLLLFYLIWNETNAVIIPFMKNRMRPRWRSQTQTICIELNKCARWDNEETVLEMRTEWKQNETKLKRSIASCKWANDKHTQLAIDATQTITSKFFFRSCFIFK